MINYYTILGLANFSSLEDIKKAHRKLSLKYHPDLNNGNKAFEEKFKVIQNAYEHLSTEEKKLTHDEYLRAYLYNQHTTNTYQTYTQQTYQRQQQYQQYQQQTYPTQQNERSFRFPWFFVIFIGMSLLRLCNQSSNDMYSNSDYQTYTFQNQKDYLDSLEEQQNSGTTNNADITNNTSPVSNKTFDIGSSSYQVIEVQGMPTTRHLTDDGKQIFYYGKSSVIIEADVVTGFVNTDSNLHLSLNNAAKSSTNNISNFTIGSSKNIVIALQGTPSSIRKNDITNEYEWRYGNSYVWMKNDVVSSYLNVDKNLKVVK